MVAHQSARTYPRHNSSRRRGHKEVTAGGLCREKIPTPPDPQTCGEREEEEKEKDGAHGRNVVANNNSDIVFPSIQHLFFRIAIIGTMQINF